jgi:hypothetical protein
METSRFMRVLLERLDKMVQEKTEAVVSGSIKTHDQYCAACESIATLRAVADSCIEIEKEIHREQTRPTGEINPVLVHKQQRRA